MSRYKKKQMQLKFLNSKINLVDSLEAERLVIDPDSYTIY